MQICLLLLLGSLLPSKLVELKLRFAIPMAMPGRNSAFQELNALLHKLEHECNAGFASSNSLVLKVPHGAALVYAVQIPGGRAQLLGLAPIHIAEPGCVKACVLCSTPHIPHSAAVPGECSRALSELLL